MSMNFAPSNVGEVTRVDCAAAVFAQFLQLRQELKNAQRAVEQ